MCSPGSCGSRAAQLTNLAAPFWFPTPSYSTVRPPLFVLSCERFRVALFPNVNWLIVGHGDSAWELYGQRHMETLEFPERIRKRVPDE